jgi:hypothetical protein
MNNIGNVSDRTMCKAGELMRLVADRLTNSGLYVGYPRRDDPCRFEITGLKEADCRIVVTDCGQIQLDWTPSARDGTDPQVIADMAACLLTGGPAAGKEHESQHSIKALTFKGLVGADLKARGFDVKLETFQDDQVFDTLTVVVAANPGSMEFPKVTISDDGSLLWEHEYWPDYGEITSKPGYGDRLSRLDEISDDAATILREAIFTAIPEPIRTARPMPL